MTLQTRWRSQCTMRIIGRAPCYSMQCGLERHGDDSEDQSGTHKAAVTCLWAQSDCARALDPHPRLMGCDTRRADAALAARECHDCRRQLAHVREQKQRPPPS